MKKRNRSYSLSFKQKAVELSFARSNVKQVCEELDIPNAVLHRWRKESNKWNYQSITDLLENSIILVRLKN